jgi:hypothetical protein
MKLVIKRPSGHASLPAQVWEAEGTPQELIEFAGSLQRADAAAGVADYATTDHMVAQAGVPIPQVDVHSGGPVLTREVPRADPEGYTSSGVGGGGVIGESAHLHDIPIESKAVDAAAIKRSTIPEGITDSLELVHAANNADPVVRAEVKQSLLEGVLRLDAEAQVGRIIGKPFVDDVPEAEDRPMTDTEAPDYKHRSSWSGC